MTGTEQLLAVARAYSEIEQLALSTVSTRVFDDGKKLAALESGAGIQVRRLEDALIWFSKNWPSDGPWPDGVPRPVASGVVAA